MIRRGFWLTAGAVTASKFSSSSRSARLAFAKDARAAESGGAATSEQANILSERFRRLCEDRVLRCMPSSALLLFFLILFLVGD